MHLQQGDRRHFRKKNITEVNLTDERYHIILNFFIKLIKILIFVYTLELYIYH